jgi:aryl-alcohol dehydrogenase-like predicted oxidoreductase
MRYYLLGHSGLRVSELCLGTMTFGEEFGWGANLTESRKVYDAFREAGGNFIDTANIYTVGTSERFLGEFMQGHRESVVLATKFTNAMPGNDPNAAGNHRKSMFQSVEASLKRLKTDYIDLYWLHIWDQITPVDEVVRAFDDLVRQGKVLYVGVSDAPAWWVAQFNTIATLRGLSPFIAIQVEYSLTERTSERELFPMCKSLGLGVTAWSPLAGGVLTGKYQKSSELEAGRFTDKSMRQFIPEAQKTERILKALGTVAQQVGGSVAQVALAWMRYRSQPVIPIIGARTLNQLQDNMGCLEVQLTTDQVALLDQASAIELGFPNDFYKKDRVVQIVYAGMRDKIIV